MTPTRGAGTRRIDGPAARATIALPMLRDAPEAPVEARVECGAYLVRGFGCSDGVGRRILPSMPSRALGTMSDAGLREMSAFLMAQRAVSNVDPAVDASTARIEAPAGRPGRPGAPA